MSIIGIGAPTQALLSHAVPSTDANTNKLDLNKLFGDNPKEIAEQLDITKSLARRGDELAIDILLNLNLPNSVYKELGEKASNALTQIYTDHSTHANVKSAIGNSILLTAEITHQAGTKLNSGLALVAGDHCYQQGRYPQLQQEITTLNDALKLFQDAQDPDEVSIHRQDRLISIEEVNAAINSHNTQVAADKASSVISSSLHIAPTLVVSGDTASAKALQLNTQIQQVKAVAQENQQAIFALPILHQGHFTLVAGNTEPGSKKISIFDSAQNQSIPDWIAQIDTPLDYLGGAFQQPSQSSEGKESPRENGCAAFCINLLRHIAANPTEQAASEQEDTVNNPAGQAIEKYVDNLHQQLPFQIDHLIRAERLNLLSNVLLRFENF
jgi:hypothetical protein